MNLGDILGGLYDRFGMAVTPDSADTRRLRKYVNEVHHEVLGMKGFGQLRYSNMTFASVASSPYATLPQAATAIINVIDRTNQRILELLSIQELRRRGPNPTLTASIPSGYSVIDYSSAVALQPSAACELFVISDAAADGTGISAYVEGTTTGGYYRRASVAMSGVTGVSLTSTITDWLHVAKFYVSAQAAGNVTLRQGSGAGPELARITPRRTYARYTLIEFNPVPAAAYTYNSDVELHVDEMLNPNDEPLFPEDYHYVLEAGALEKEYLKRKDFPSASAEAVRKRNGIADMRTFLRKRQGNSTGRPAQFSQLGAWFPNGS